MKASKIKRGQYQIERAVKVSGELKETLNVFRNILGGDLTLDVSEYEAVAFELFADKDVEVILVTKDLVDWNQRLRYTIKANDKKQTYTIPFSEFYSKAKQRSTIKNLRSVVFSIQGDYKNSTSFTLDISKLSFTLEKESIENVSINNSNITVTNAPNPFSTQTIVKMPTANQKITISVIDMLGRIVQEEELTNEGRLSYTFTFTAKHLAQGIYKYIIRGDNFKKRYEGSFLIR